MPKPTSNKELVLFTNSCMILHKNHRPVNSDTIEAKSELNAIYTANKKMKVKGL